MLGSSSELFRTPTFNGTARWGYGGVARPHLEESLRRIWEDDEKDMGKRTRREEYEKQRTRRRMSEGEKGT